MYGGLATKLKNKNIKINISLKQKLLMINIIVVLIILIATSFGIFTLRNEANLSTIISDFNQLYTEAARYINLSLIHISEPTRH